MRVKITLACTECKQRNYDTNKNKKNDPDRLEMNKFCKFCRKHTLHKETKYGIERICIMADLNNKTTDVQEKATKKEKKPKEKKPNIFKRLFGFLRDCVSELKKVTWLSRKETTKSTFIVLAVVVALSVVIGVVDTAFEFGILGLHNLYNYFS